MFKSKKEENETNKKRAMNHLSLMRKLLLFSNKIKGINTEIDVGNMREGGRRDIKFNLGIIGLSEFEYQLFFEYLLQEELGINNKEEVK